MDLPDDLVALLRAPSTCYLATLMRDGAPHLTQTWVDTDGTHILINSVEGFQKVRNVGRDPRVAVTVFDPAEPTRYYAVRGRVVDVTTEGAVDHIESLSQRYLGREYPWWGGRGQVRLILAIEAQQIKLIG